MYLGYKRVKNGSARTDTDRRRGGGPFGRVIGCSCSVEWYCVRALACTEQVVAVHQICKISATYAKIRFKIGSISAWHNVLIKRCTPWLRPDSSFQPIPLK